MVLSVIALAPKIQGSFYKAWYAWYTFLYSGILQIWQVYRLTLQNFCKITLNFGVNLASLECKNGFRYLRQVRGELLKCLQGYFYHCFVSFIDRSLQLTFDSSIQIWLRKRYVANIIHLKRFTVYNWHVACKLLSGSIVWIHSSTPTSFSILFQCVSQWTNIAVTFSPWQTPDSWNSIGIIDISNN